MTQVLEKKIDTIIFDFDNTVVDSFQSVFTNFNALLTGRGMYPVEQTTFSDKYVPDWTKMLTEMGMKVQEHQMEIKRFVERYHSELSRKNIRTGMKDTISDLKNSGFKTILLASSPANVIQSQTQANDLKFDLILSTEMKAMDKKNLLSESVKKTGMNPESAIYIGSIVEDLLAAKKMGMKTIAITSGHQSVSRLRQAKADRILQNTNFLHQAIIELTR